MKRRLNKKLRSDLILVLITAFWGISFPLIRNVLEYIPAIPYLAIRFLLAAFFLSIAFFNKHKSIKKTELAGGVKIGFFLVAGMMFQVYGLYTTSASNSAFITSMSVVFVPLLLAVLFKIKTDKLTVLGVIIASTGLFLLSGFLKFEFNMGDILTLFCAVAFAFQIIYIDRYTNKGDPAAIAIVQLWTAAAITSLIWLLFDKSPIYFNVEIVIVFLVTSILGTAFAYTAQILVQKNTTPSHTALIFTTEPLFALFFVLIIPDNAGNFEKLEIMKGVGAFLILGGTILSEYKTIKNVFLKKKNKKMK